MKNMKINIKGITTSLLSILAVATATTLINSVQAAPWKTLPPSVCQVHNPGDVKSGQVKYWSSGVTHANVTGGPSTTLFYCPIKVDDNAPNTVGVWLNYSEVDDVQCWLRTNHWTGYPKLEKAFVTPAGLHRTNYKEIHTGYWWSVHVQCRLGNQDEINSFNYKGNL